MVRSRAVSRRLLVAMLATFAVASGCAAESSPGSVAEAVPPDVAVEAAPDTQPGPSTDLAAPGAPDAAAARELLEVLPVQPEQSEGYDRKRFSHWDRLPNGCSVREQVLIDESRGPAQVDPFGCKVVAGDWISVYDGVATSDPAELDIDHVVALAEAWRSGAHGWDDARRRAFANDLADPDTLVAVTSSSNRSKADHDPAHWLPDALDHCTYAATWVRIKATWSLSVDPAERAALLQILDGC